MHNDIEKLMIGFPEKCTLDLLIDIGNTRVKWALSTEGQLTSTTGQMAYRGIAISDLCGEMWGNLDRPDRIIVACVAPNMIREEIATWTDARWNLKAEFVASTAAGWGIVNAYRSPESLGVDRWLGLIAARKKWNSKNVFVADCGTAVTIDVLSREGVHLGGLIVPGLSMMRQSLIQGTAKIEVATNSDMASNHVLFASDTTSAVMGGTLYTLVSVLDRTVRDVGVELGQSVIPVITGGNADELRSLLSTKFLVAPELVLEGLAIVSSENP